MTPSELEPASNIIELPRKLNWVSKKARMLQNFWPAPTRYTKDEDNIGA